MTNLYTGFWCALWSAALLFLPLAASSSDQPLVLKHGVYVRGPSCKDAPNAEMLVWDGKGFSGAHSSQCTSEIMRQSGARFQVKTTCLALGDGAPNPSGFEYTDSFLLNRLSSTLFEQLKENHTKATFRWCRMGTISH